MTRSKYAAAVRRAMLCAFAALAGWAAIADEPPVRPQGNPALVSALAPVLADWIVRSRDAAIAQGVAEIPEAIRAVLAGYVPDATLDRVRWRAGAAGEMSLQQNAFSFGDVPAITLDHVIVFADQKTAREDPKLWAHELKHVMQYAEWGVAGFASRYLLDYEAVEKEAADYRWELMKARGLTPPPATPR